MVCILLALPNITFFLMFSAHKPLQSTSWVSDHLMMSLDGVCAYVFLLSFITLMIYFTCTKFFFLRILVILFALSNLNPLNSLTGATVPGIKPHVFWCVEVIYFCNSVPSGLPNIRFSCTSLSPDRVYSVVLIISIINSTFTKFFLFVVILFAEVTVTVHQTSSFLMFWAHYGLLQSIYGFESSDVDVLHCRLAVCITQKCCPHHLPDLGIWDAPMFFLLEILWLCLLLSNLNI